MRLISIFTILLICSQWVLAATDSSSAFSPAQQQQIKTLIHQYLIQNPEVLLEMSKALDRKQKQAVQEKTRAVTLANSQEVFAYPHDPVAGNPKGQVSVVEIFDYQCMYCKIFAATIEDLIKSNSQLRVIYKPIVLFGDNSLFASKAALAAQKQHKFVAFHHALMQTKQALNPIVVMEIAEKVGMDTRLLANDIKDPEVIKTLQHNEQLIQKLDINFTPVMIMARYDQKTNQVSHFEFIPGVVKQALIQQLIDKTKSS